MKLVVATNNLNKVKEIAVILKRQNYEILSLRDFPGVPVVIEDGSSFEENAVKKASIIAEHTGLLTLADDSGLEVDALNGEPGVKSARFAGENATDEDRNHKLLNLLKDVPESRRSARFKCAMALSTPQGDTKVVLGVCEGSIAFEPRGNTGFGYDPVFFVPCYGKTFAELGPDIKNRISHRAIAIQKIKKLFRSLSSDVLQNLFRCDSDISSPSFSRLEDWFRYRQRYQKPQQFIDDFIIQKRIKVRFTFPPTFEPNLAAFGKVRIGEFTQIGQKALVRDSELCKTLIHEEIHHRLAAREKRGDIKARKLRGSLALEENYADEAANRYFRLKSREVIFEH
jgi:XTP/dITP diphosphohydrolase